MERSWAIGTIMGNADSLNIQIRPTDTQNLHENNMGGRKSAGAWIKQHWSRADNCWSSFIVCRLVLCYFCTFDIARLKSTKYVFIRAEHWRGIKTSVRDPWVPNWNFLHDLIWRMESDLKRECILCNSWGYIMLCPQSSHVPSESILHTTKVHVVFGEILNRFITQITHTQQRLTWISSTQNSEPADFFLNWH